MVSTGLLWAEEGRPPLGLEDGAEELLLPERVLRRRHGDDEGVFPHVRFAVGQEVRGCLGDLRGHSAGAWLEARSAWSRVEACMEGGHARGQAAGGSANPGLVGRRCHGDATREARSGPGGLKSWQEGPGPFVTLLAGGEVQGPGQQPAMTLLLCFWEGKTVLLPWPGPGGVHHRH